jgi:hypothetical protein
MTLPHGNRALARFLISTLENSMPRLPIDKARMTGAALKNPQRYRGRTEPHVEALGEASPYLDGIGRQAFDCFRRELPWLTEADRALVEVGAVLRARIMAGADSVAALRGLAAVLTKLGATPTDRSRVAGHEADDDPDEFFGRA